MRKSSRRSDQRIPPRATLPPRRWTPSTRGRVDEDLEERPRLGQIRDQVGVELQRQVRLGLPALVGLEVVRAQDGAHDAEEAAQDPVLVQARDAVDRRRELAGERARLRVRVLEADRVEPEPEELDEPAGDGRVRVEGVLHVGLAEGASGLAEVLRDRAQHGDLPRRQAAREHEPVEAVVLRLVAPDPGEGVLERLAHVVGLELRPLVVPEPEVVDPDRLAALRPHLVRALVADPDAHVLEQRQHVREQDRPARAEQLEGEVVGGRGEGHVEAHAQVAAGPSRSIRSMSSTACRAEKSSR